MLKHYGKENLTRLAADCQFGPGTASRIKDAKTSVGVDILDKIATHFHVEPWHLLIAGFNPDNLPTLQPLSPREAELYKRWREVTKEFIKEESQ